MLAVFCVACNKDALSDNRMCFVGDSMIANWDVERFFPNRITENLGRDGIGLTELTSIRLDDAVADIILLIGTNDLLPGMTDDGVSGYVDKYLSAIKSFRGKRVLLISVLPTANKEKNNRIELFNKLVQERINDPHLIYVDCYSSFLRSGVLREEFSRDGLHINDYGYNMLTDILKGKL